MASFDYEDDIFGEITPVIYVLSDSRGETAMAVVKAAAAQFDEEAVEIVRLSNISDIQTVRDYFESSFDPNRPSAVFHTFADGVLRREVRRELDKNGIPSIDLLGPAVTVISSLTGEEPSHVVGAIYRETERF